MTSPTASELFITIKEMTARYGCSYDAVHRRLLQAERAGVIALCRVGHLKMRRDQLPLLDSFNPNKPPAAKSDEKPSLPNAKRVRRPLRHIK